MGRTLRLDPKTVRRYATAATADQLIGGAHLARPGLLGPHQDWLQQRCRPVLKDLLGSGGPGYAPARKAMVQLGVVPGLVAGSLLRGLGQLGGRVNLCAEPGGRGAAFTHYPAETGIFAASGVTGAA
jgi:hypothetical protein